MLKNEVTQLKQLLLTHKDCPITTMQKESQGYLSESLKHKHTQTRSKRTLGPTVLIALPWRCFILSETKSKKKTNPTSETRRDKYVMSCILFPSVTSEPLPLIAIRDVIRRASFPCVVPARKTRLISVLTECFLCKGKIYLLPDWARRSSMSLTLSTHVHINVIIIQLACVQSWVILFSVFGVICSWVILDRGGICGDLMLFKICLSLDRGVYLQPMFYGDM